jgi:signal peptidase I
VGGRAGKPSWRRLLLELPVLLLVALGVAWALKSFVGQAYHIPSESMEPQLDVGDRVVVSRLAYRLHDPRRGDIIVFDEPGSEGADASGVLHVVGEILQGVGLRQPDQTELIKRVIGLPGEVVEARGGRVLVDGRELVEPYLPAGVGTADFGPVTVPDGHVFVLGDNRGNSVDSRFASVGPVPVDNIVGRAVARVWPPWRWANL